VASASASPRTAPARAHRALARHEHRTHRRHLRHLHRRHAHHGAAKVHAAKRGSSGPTTPNALSASGISGSSITLSWKPSSSSVGIAGYNLYANAGTVGTTTATSYTFTGLACGTSYTLGVSAFDTSGAVSSKATTSATTTACAPANMSAPANTSAPAIAGQATVGQTLTASTGGWSGSPTAYAYQWSDCSSSGPCAPIANATGSSYTASTADVGSTVVVAVTASNSGGTATASSAPAGPVASPAPSGSVSWPASYTDGPLGANNILPSTSSGVLLIDWYGYGGYTWSQEQSAILQRETDMGRAFDGIGLHYSSDSTYNGVANCIDSTDIGNDMPQWVHDHGSVPIVTWSPSATLDQIASGAFDNCYVGVADYFRQFPFRIMLRMMWEQDGTWFPWSACGTKSSTATPSEYVADWQRIVNIFRQQGATNVGFFWTPTEGYNRSCADATYPGDAYVDWVGTDQYNADDTSWSTPLHSGWAEFNEMFNYTALGATQQSRESMYGPRKPFIVGETGSKYDSSNGSRKANWFTNIASVAAPSMPYLRGVEFFDQWVSSEGNDWRLDSNQTAGSTTIGSSDPTTYQGFINMARAAVFNAGVAGGAS
jgi:hypothetical protein